MKIFTVCTIVSKKMSKNCAHYFQIWLTVYTVLLMCVCTSKTSYYLEVIGGLGTSYINGI